MIDGFLGSEAASSAGTTRRLPCGPTLRLRGRPSMSGQRLRLLWVSLLQDLLSRLRFGVLRHFSPWPNRGPHLLAILVEARRGPLAAFHERPRLLREHAFASPRAGGAVAVLCQLIVGTRTLQDHGAMGFLR